MLAGRLSPFLPISERAEYCWMIIVYRFSTDTQPLLMNSIVEELIIILSNHLTLDLITPCRVMGISVGFGPVDSTIPSRGLHFFTPEMRA